MNLEWVTISEAAVPDGRGVLSIIGLEQNVAITPQLPANIQRAITLHFSDRGQTVEPGTRLKGSVTLIAPSGEPMGKRDFALSIGAKRFPEYPGSVDTALDMTFPAPEYGTYLVRCAVTQPRRRRLERQIFVVPPPD